jgi:hypothetical protein
MHVQGSRGRMYMALMFNAEELGVSLPEPRPERAIQLFLNVGSGDTYTAITPRLIKMPNGVLLCSAVHGKADSGAIYIYDRESGNFYMVLFTVGREYDLTVEEYEALVEEYALREYAAKPSLIQMVLRCGDQPAFPV